jgi:universal stress protein A
MLGFLDRSTDAVLGVKASGKLTHADYQQLIPKLEQIIEAHGRVRVLVELEDCTGWELAAAWDDLKFVFRHGRDVERCAVVGKSRWQKWLARLSRPFVNVRYFPREQLEQAWQWVLEGGPGTSGPGKRYEAGENDRGSDMVPMGLPVAMKCQRGV